MPRFPRSRRAWLVLTGLLLLLTLLFLAISDNAAIWPVRNTLLYHATRWWEAHVGPSQPSGVGALHGCGRIVDLIDDGEVATCVLGQHRGRK